MRQNFIQMGKNGEFQLLLLQCKAAVEKLNVCPKGNSWDKALNKINNNSVVFTILCFSLSSNSCSPFAQTVLIGKPSTSSCFNL